MSDKNLSELEWKKFAKGRDLKDAALVKAMAALEKAKAPDQSLAALDDLEKQSDLLRKSAKGDKDLAKYLDDLDKALDKERKLSEFEAKKAAKEAAKDQGGDEEEETPALLTSKMIPLIRQVKKGDEMQVLLASAGKDVAVMLSRRAISPSKRKLLTEYLDGGAAKFFPGICIFEENAYTFVLKTQAGGLAKKVKAALLRQVELRLKVRVRGEDPNDIDDDGEPAEDEAVETQGEAVNEAPTQGTAPEVPPVQDPLKADYDRRMAVLEPRVLETLKAQHGDVSKIRAVAEFVREKGAGGQYKAALSGLDSLEKLLQAADAAAPAPIASPDSAAAAFNSRLAALMPEVKTAITAGGETGLEVKLKVSEAGVFARKKEFDRANELLDEAEALMKAPADGDNAQDQASEDETPQEEIETDEPKVTGGAVAGLQSRLAEGLNRLDLLDDPKVESALARVLASIKGAIEAGDAGAALPQLARLEEVLEAAERRKSAGSPIERNLVKYRTAHAEWLNAEQVAVGALRKFGKQVLAHPDIAGSPNFAEVKQYVETLPTQVPTFGAELGAMLRSIEEADADEARVAAVANSQDKIRSYQEDLLGDSVLVGLEQFAAKNFSGLDVLSPLRTALGRLEALLKI